MAFLLFVLSNAKNPMWIRPTISNFSESWVSLQNKWLYCMSCIFGVHRFYNPFSYGTSCDISGKQWHFWKCSFTKLKSQIQAILSAAPALTQGQRLAKRSLMSWPMSTGSAHLYHTTHTSSAGEVQHCFPTELPLTSTPFLLVWNKAKRRGHSGKCKRSWK